MSYRKTLLTPVEEETIEQNRAMEKIITTGISDDRFIEVESGLNQGDKIVVKGYEFLRNRGKVKIMK